MKKNRKNSTKSLLACAVLAGVLAGGFGLGVSRAEAADFSWKVTNISKDVEEYTWDGSSDLDLVYEAYLSRFFYSPVSIKKFEIWGEGASTEKSVYGCKSFDTYFLNVPFEIIFNSGKVENIYGLYSTLYYTLSNKTVTINGGTITGLVAGVFSSCDNVSNSTVNITGGTFGGKVYGGYTGGGNANNNMVTISGGTFADHIYGGYTGGGNANNNMVTISGGSGTYAYGGNGTAEANDNEVNISGGEYQTLYGGHAGNGGVAKGNIVRISGGKIDGEGGGLVYGGKATNGTVSGNKVILSGGDLSNAKVYGWGDAATHEDNTLQIENPVTVKEIGNFENIYFDLPSNFTAADDVMLNVSSTMSLEGISFITNIGALSLNNGDKITLIQGVDSTGFTSNDYYGIEGNKLIYKYIDETLDTEHDYTIRQWNLKYDSGNDGTHGNVQGNTTVGGLSDKSYCDNEIIIRRGRYLDIFGVGISAAVDGYNITVKNNTVRIYGGTMRYVYGGDGYDGYVSNNVVNMTAGTAERVYGGYGGSSSVISGNIVSIAGGEVNLVAGGYANLCAKAVNGNSVNITGGTVNYVYGGSNFFDDEDISGEVNDNIVRISGGKVAKAIYGSNIAVSSWRIIDSDTAGAGGYGYYTASNNKVIVSGGDLSEAAVYGWYASTNLDTSVFSLINRHDNNTLQIENAVAIKEIYNFENIDFVLPAGIADNATMLKLANAANLNLMAVSVYLNGQTPNNITLIDKVENNNTYNVYTGTIGSTELSDNYIILLESGKLLLKLKEFLWYTVGTEAKKFATNAAAQSISGVSDDVTIYRGTTYDGETKTGNEYASIDATGHKVTIDSENPITVTGDLTAAEVVINAERTLIMGSGKKLTANGVDNRGTLNIGAGDLVSDVTNSGTVNLGAGTLASGSTITGGTLNITDNVTANAGDIAGDTNTVAEGKTLTFNGGAVTHKVTGEGTLKFASDMEINADNAAAATSIVDSGVTLTVNGGTFDKKLGGSGTLNITGTLHYGTNAELVQTGTQHVGDRDIPVSDVNVTIAAGGVMDMKDRASTPGGCINALTFAGGKLDFSGGYVGNLLIAKTLDATGGGRISFDVSASGNDQIGVLTSVANGSNLTLDTINVQGELAGDVAPAGGVSGSITFALDLSGGNLSNLTIAGTTTVSGNYMYTFTQDASDKGKLNYKKEMGMGLMQVIQAKDINGNHNDSYAQIANYSFNGERGMNFEPYSQSKIDTLTGDAKTNAENLNKRYGDLGEMKRATGATTRTLTINGNGSTLSGGVYAGVTVNNGDTFVLKNVRTVADAKDNKIATNNGTVLLSGSGTMDVKASVDGTGKLIFDGVDAVLGENYQYITGRTALTADELADLKAKVDGGTATEIETKEYNFGWKLNDDGSYVTTLSGVTSAVITQNDLEIRSGSLTANADNLHITNSIVNNGEIKFTGGTLAKAVTGTGNLTFDGNVSTNANNIATTGTNTVNNGKTLTFNGGTLAQKVEGAGNLYFNGDVTTNADNIATTGTNEVADGKTITFNGGTLTKKIEGAGNLKFTDNVTANADNIATEGTNTVADGKTLTFNAGALTKKIEGAGGLTFAVDMTLNANNIGTTGTNTVADGKTLTFNDGTLAQKIEGAGGLTFAADMTINADNIGTEGTNTVADGRTLTFDSGTLAQKVQGTGNITIDGDVTTNANNIATTGTNTVNSGKTLTFNGGTLAQKVQGTGNITIDGDVTTNANNIATTGTNTVASGKTLTFNGGILEQKIEGAGNLKFTGNVTADADNIATEGTNEVATGATLSFADGTLTKNIAGDGTTEFNNTVSVANDVNLGTNTNNVNGTLDVAEHITASNINFQSGSTLKVDGTKITDTAAITGITSATVASGSKLYVSNAVKDTAYKILDGSGGIDVSSWTTDGDMGEGFRASYGLIVDTDNTTAAGTGLSEFHIQFKEDTAATGSSDIGNIIASLPAGSEAKAWVDNISASQPDMQTQGNTVNTMANIGSLANVQGGMSAMSSFTSNSIAANIGSESRPMLGNGGQGSGFRNVSANVKLASPLEGKRADKGAWSGEGVNETAIETVEQGKASEVMPLEYKDKVYDRQVWASFIHSKTKIEGMKTGHLEQDSTLQYNGTVVGVDLWSGRHGFGGIALTYGDGNFHSGQMVSNVKNDADYYGISVYNRQDVGRFSFQYDAGFTYAKNDVTMSTAGAEDVTAKPKVRAYSAGIKVEEPIKVGRAAEVVPFAGARYTFVKSKEYQNSLGLGYDVDNQHLVKIPVGMSLRTKYLDKSGWKFGTTLSGGYSWNLCNRSSRQRVSFGGYSDMIDFDITDRGEYFVNAAVQAEFENLLFELGYNYSKGKTTRSNKWYFNANLGF